MGLGVMKNTVCVENSSACYARLVDFINSLIDTYGAENTIAAVHATYSNMREYVDVQEMKNPDGDDCLYFEIRDQLRRSSYE